MRQFCHFILVCLVATQVQAAGEVEILGTVVKIDGKKITVSSDSEFLPSAGDPVEIFVELEGIGKATVAHGKVIGIVAGAISAEIEQASGNIAEGHQARIVAAKPQRREKVSVPVLVGRTERDAKAAMTAVGLVLQSRVGIDAPTGVRPMTVYQQDPLPGSEVVKGSSVKITLFGGTADEPKMDDSPKPPATTADTTTELAPWPGLKPDQPWLGVSRWWANQREVVLCGVLKNSPAGKAGLQVDDTILTINGEEIHNIRDFHNAIDSCTVAADIVIEFERGGEKKTTTVTLEAIPRDGGNGRILAAAKAGESWAMMDIGVRYANMRGKVSYFERDNNEAVRWFQEADKAGYAAGPLFLAKMYERGHGVEQDYEKARELYERARSVQGDGVSKGLYSSATAKLAYLYRNGHGVDRSEERALALFQAAAEQGSLAATYAIGQLYEQGETIPRDVDKAMEWYHKAARNGYVYAQYQIGRMAYSGIGVEKDYDTALGWFRMAAERDHTPGQTMMGVMYRDGLGVQRDYTKAMEWLNKARKAKSIVAPYHLGFMYLQGQGVAKNARRAQELFSESASLGYAEGQFMLGWTYEQHQGRLSGLSRAEARERAIKEYRAAAAQGHEQASDALRRLGLTQ